MQKNVLPTTFVRHSYRRAQIREISRDFFDRPRDNRGDSPRDNRTQYNKIIYIDIKRYTVVYLFWSNRSFDRLKTPYAVKYEYAVGNALFSCKTQSTKSSKMKLSTFQKQTSYKTQKTDEYPH